ncbi:hypothetical protein PG984_005634 [Apiospora sp. TS-2023a]
MMLLVHSSSLDLGSVANPPPTVVKRVPAATTTSLTYTPTITGQPEWPFDPNPQDPNALNWKDPTNYNCNLLANQYNQIPSQGLTASPRVAKADWQSYQNGQVYSDEEIYRAFRDGGMLLWSAQNGHINLADWQFMSYSGALFPRPFLPPDGWHYEEHFIGLGTWHGSRSRHPGTTTVHEWPLVPGGNWPQGLRARTGFDRVLFQLVNNVPLYLGVISSRGVYPNPTPMQRRMSWGFIQNQNGHVDNGAVQTLHYPGIETDTPGLPEPEAIKFTRDDLRQKDKSWDEVYGGTPEPPDSPDSPPPGFDPGSGAGGGSGNYPTLFGPGG